MLDDTPLPKVTNLENAMKRFAAVIELHLFVGIAEKAAHFSSEQRLRISKALLNIAQDVAAHLNDPFDEAEMMARVFTDTATAVLPDNQRMYFSKEDALRAKDLAAVELDAPDATEKTKALKEQFSFFGEIAKRSTN